MNFKKTIWILLTVSTAQFAAAEVIGFEVGVNHWNFDTSGSVSDPLDTAAQANINFEDNNELSVFVTLEHPVPFLPNIKVQQNPLTARGTVPLSSPDFLGGEVVMARGAIDLSHSDLILYYELLDNWVNLDLGLSAKYFDGYSRIRYEDLINDEANFKEWIPMLYGKAQFDLPFSGFSAAASLEALTLDDSEVIDLDLALKYRHKLGLGAEVGYRMLDVDIQNSSSFRGDVKADGVYLGVHLDF